MKLQIDTDKKVIRVLDSVNLAKLVDTLNNLFPNKEWKKFTLETNAVINNWHSPIVIERYSHPYTFPWSATYTAGNTNSSLKAAGALQLSNTSATYNVNAK